MTERLIERHLGQAFGIELEYMLVDRASLAVQPIADQVLQRAGGGPDADVDRGPIAWSNELALHVLELKTNGPVAHLEGVAEAFQAELQLLDGMLAELGARILPTAMHPFMDPHRELRLWPHENDVIYRTFDRIFDCRGHGWANLQSMHINLPFWGDEEFGHLHAAIRLVLPILPALAASSPITDGIRRPDLDTRMRVYAHNADRVPRVGGQVVPERVFSRAAYEREILEPLWADLAPLDPEGVLRGEWVNARGAIARFDRMAIEIRVLDIQECPAADLAIAAAVTSVIDALCAQRWGSLAAQQAHDASMLAAIFDRTVRDADAAVISEPAYLEAFGLPARAPVTAGELWSHLVETVVDRDPRAAFARSALEIPLGQGPLARRILSAVARAQGRAVAVGEAIDRRALGEVYGALAACARDGRLFSL